MNCRKCSDIGLDLLTKRLCNQPGCIAAQARVEYNKYAILVLEDWCEPQSFDVFLASFKKNVRPQLVLEKLGTKNWLHFEKAFVSSIESGFSVFKPDGTPEAEFELLYNQVLQLLGERKTV